MNTAHKQVTERFIVNHAKLTSRFIATRIQEKLQQHSSYTPKEIQDDLKRELGVDVGYSKAWRAKEAALNNINGTFEESYAMLPKYCNDLVNTNPGTTAFVEKTEDKKFKRMFVAFGAAAKGFAYCHPLLGLDGTHLKSKYLGILLAATSIDSLGQLFPVAFAVVNAENDENWLWFLKTLRTTVIQPYAPEFLNNHKLVLLSDRQKGLIDGVNTVFPGLPHGYCLRHLEENFHKKFKNVELKKLLWKAARAMEKEVYEAAIADMVKINAGSVPWLQEHAPSQHWSELHFHGRRYGHLTSNIAESLNTWLLEAREMPVLPMLERIRHQLMGWYDKHRGLETETVGLLVKPVGQCIQALINDRSSRYRFLSSNNICFEVKSGITMTDYLVNIMKKTCSCHAWQTTGIPCEHALAILIALRLDPQAYTQPFFTLEFYRKTYENAIFHPLLGNYQFPLIEMLENASEIDDNEEQSDEESLLPPNTRRPSGRPQKRWIRGGMDQNRYNKAPRRQNRCGRCKGLGHSKKTCVEAI